MANGFYDMQLPDGSVITNIPEGMTTDTPELRAFYETIKSQGVGEYQFQGAQPTPQTQETIQQPEIIQEPQKQTVLEDIKGGAAATARGAIPFLTAEMVSTPIVDTVNRLLGTNLQRPAEAMSELFTRIGIEEPDTEAEKLVQAMSEGAIGAMTSIGAGGLLQAGKGLGQTVAKGVGGVLAGQPAGQIAGGVAGEAGGEIARQAGASPAVQFGATVLGDVAGGGLANIGLEDVPIKPIQEATERGVRVLASDVRPPKTRFGKVVQDIQEQLPFVGTGGLRSAQEGERIQAITELVQEFDADSLVDNPEAAYKMYEGLVQDVATKRKSKLAKYADDKSEVINRLSKGKEPDLSYRIDHQIDYDPEYVSQLDNLTMTIEGDELIPSDFFQHPEWYANMSSPEYQESFNVIRQMQGDPDGMVTIYRGVPKDVDSINSGDWVSLSKQYAIGEAIESDAKVISKRVPAKEIIWDGNDINEFAWYGEGDVSPTSVPMTKTQEILTKEINNLRNLNTPEVEPLITKLEGWQKAFQGKDLATTEKQRKILGQSYKAQELGSIQDESQKVINRIYNKVNEDMGDYIKTTGEPKDFNKWKIANKRLSGMIKETNNASLKKILNKGEATPEMIRGAIFSKNRSDTLNLYKNLTPKGKASVRSVILADVAQKSLTGDTISPAKFTTQLRKAANERGVFFTNPEMAQIEGLVRVLDTTKRASQSVGIPQTGVRTLIPASTATIAALIPGTGLERILGTAAVGTGMGLSARAYESKAVRDILMKIPRVKAGSPAEGELIRRLNEIVRTIDIEE